MIMKLKTLDQIKEEYNHYYNDDGDICFIDHMMYITRYMKHMFGKVHKVEIVNNSYIIYDITHDDNPFWYFHKDWFTLINFIEDGEMIL